MEPSKLPMESKDSRLTDAAVTKAVFDEIVRTGSMEVTASMAMANLAAASHSPTSSRNLGQEVGGKAVESEVVGRPPQQSFQSSPKLEQIDKSSARTVGPQHSSPAEERQAAGKQVYEQRSQYRGVFSNRHDGQLSTRQIDMLERGYKRPRGGQNAAYHTNLHKLKQEWKQSCGVESCQCTT